MVASTLVSAIVWIGLVAVLSAAGAVVVRRRVSVDVLKQSEASASAILGAVGTLFTVVLAFTIVIVWGHFTAANEAVEAEATHIGDLARLARGFPAADEQRIKQSLIKYVSVVVDDEWPAMADGHDDARAWNAMTDLWESYLAIKPSDAAHQAVYSESLTHLTVLADARRQRLHALHDNVPGLMWIALMAGGVVVVMTTYLFAPHRLLLHAVMAGTVGWLIALNLFLIYTLDNPFRGWPKIGPDSLREELQRIEAHP